MILHFGVIHDSVSVAIISGLSGIIVAGITMLTRKKVQEKRNDRQPKDRMEQMFDGYERLIKQKDTEDDRKAKSIANLERNVEILESELETTRQALEETREALRISRDENKELKDMLKKMRQEYHHTKHQS